MKLKPAFLIGCCVAFSSLAVLVLYYLSDQEMRRNNSFLRILLKDPIHYVGGMDLPYNSYYIAGASVDQIYLGNFAGLRHILKLNPSLTDSQHVTIAIRDLEKRKFHSSRVFVRPPHFYITDGVVPALLRGSITDWKADNFISDKSAFFIDAIPLGNSSFAIRSVSARSGELTLGKIYPDSPYVKLMPHILQKQIDGKFCTDGKLLFDPESNEVVYFYIYRNEFIVMDSSMNLMYRGKTIDTVSHAQIRAVKKRANQSYTMSAPPLIVNENGGVSNGLLFIKSPLLSGNELEKVFAKLTVVDVYDLKGASYLFSFYVPKFDGRSFREFMIHENLLIVLYDRRIETFRLNPKYFSVNIR